MNHEEGGAKRGRGFQEAICQLPKLLVLKHEKKKPCMMVKSV